MLALLFISILLEWLLYVLPFLWRVRQYFVAGPLALTAFGSVGLLFESWSPLVLFAGVVSLFRILNQVRIAKGRMHERYLHKVALRTGLVLGALQIAALGLNRITLAWATILDWLVIVQVVLAGLLLLSLIRNLIKTKHRETSKHYSDKELPTVTVAIPARNETADLEDCLRSILANNYPKLEVIVLDDCSHDKTAEVIKSFAHDGVRFVKGYEPGKRWLAKNQAYDKLADEATGELILFCGVDVRFGPEAVRSLVTTLLNRKKSMVSVMPRRLASEPLASFIQPLRYWWELAPPRRYFNRPPVLSTCWLVRRKKLQELGGFEAVQHAIIPEGYFARELIKTDDYSFVRANNTLDVLTEKSLVRQRDTALRMRYPQVRRRPEWVLLVSLIEILFLLGPFIVLASALWAGSGTVQLLALIASTLLVVSHVLIVQVSDPANTLIAALNFPLVVLTELFVGYASMLKYEFSTVEWKERNICIPVMHTYPHLPKLDKGNPKS